MEKELIRKLAQELVTAEDTCTPVEKFSDRFGSAITIKDAYDIQSEVLAIKSARGERSVGKKIGLTSKGIREQIGVFEPDYGVICNKGVIPDGGELKMCTLIKPQVEPEIAFVMKEDLKGPFVTPWDVIRATEGIMPAIEVVDSRFVDWKFKIYDTIADTASYARIVTGSKLTPLDGLDLSVLGMASYKNGELMGTATGAAVMENPVNAVVWLANKMIECGKYIQKGEIVLSGSFTPVFPVKAGDFIEVKFDRIGDVKLKVVE